MSLRGAKRRGNPYSCGSTNRKAILWANTKSTANLPYVLLSCQVFLRGNGLPHQCAHWLAMTCRRRAAVSGCKDAFRQYPGSAPWQTQTPGKFLPVIARSEATWQSVLLRQHKPKSNPLGEYEKHCEFAPMAANFPGISAGKRIAAPVCALVRNDMQKEEALLRL